MTSSPPRARALLAMLLLAACAGGPPGARTAQRRLAAGDYPGAEQVADDELARFPDHPTLLRIKIEAAFGRGEAGRGVDLYEQWRARRGGHEPGTLRALALRTLWQGLQVGSPAIRRAAIEAAERLELELLAEPIARLLDDEEPIVAAAAAVALLRSHPDAPVVATESLRSDDPEARALAVSGIGRKVGAAARADLLAALADPDGRVRAAAVGAVARLRNPADGPALLALAARDPDGPARAAALQALADARYPGVLPAARAGVRDAYLGARLAAVGLLDKRGGAEAGPALIALSSEADLLVGLRAGAALARRGDRAPGRAAIGRALASPEWTVRAAALNAAAEVLPAAEAATVARAAGSDADAQVRLAAARTLVRAGDQAAAAPLLLAALALPDDQLRVQAALDLVAIGNPRGSDALEDLAGHAAPSARPTAVRGLAHFGKPSRALVRALADETAAVRIIAAEVLYAMTNED